MRTEEQLKASQKEVGDLKAALDEHAIVAITDPQGKITYVNEKFCAISQYSREELIGQDHRIINSGYHTQEFIRNLWTTIAHGRVWKGEIKNKAKDGSFYWVDTTIVPFLNEEGKPRQYVAIRADITERKRSEAAAARLAAIVRSSEDAIIGKDLNGIVTSWNAGAEATFGYSESEMLGQPIMRLIPPDRQHEEAEILARVRRGESIRHFDTVRLRKDGSTLDVSVAVSAIKDAAGVIIGASKIARDVSARKEAAEKINRLNSELEQRVIERTVQLESANKELEAFSYSVSHDLRAPLRAVDGYSLAVLEDFGPQLPDEGRRQLQTIRDSAQKMGELIDNLLSFARLSRKELKKRAIDTGQLVRGLLDELGAPWPGRQVDVRIADLPPCNGDPALLKQVWVNLLTNALKYTGNRERAVIEVGSVKTDGIDTFFVRDNGTGFDMRYAGKLFGVFQRLHRSEEYEGTGVGLAIVQRIVLRHGGLRVGGCRGRSWSNLLFYLGKGANPMNDPNAVELLLVEDNPQDLEMTLRALKKANLANRIHVARDGSEAIEFIFCEGAHAGRRLSDGPRVVLLDIKLPKVDGLEVLKRIKGDPRTKAIPVVMLTSSKEQSDVIESYQLGVNSYIVKPVNFEGFAEAVRNLGLYWLLLNHPPQSAE